MVNGSPLSTHISASILWNDKLEFGISHRIENYEKGNLIAYNLL
ncbi:hypothetical protein [uncultured Lutibacter sp.]|nr:hypothetical protein [uncultured Lutibacter sp.]